MNFVRDDVMFRQAYWCPECGRVKDAEDERRYDLPETRTAGARWCHAYSAHGGGKRRMRPICIETPVATAFTREERA